VYVACLIVSETFGGVVFIWVAKLVLGWCWFLGIVIPWFFPSQVVNKIPPFGVALLLWCQFGFWDPAFLFALMCSL